MRRIYKKYQLLVWLAWLLTCGGLISTATIYTLSRDLLTEQRVNQHVSQSDPFAAASPGLGLNLNLSAAANHPAGSADHLAAVVRSVVLVSAISASLLTVLAVTLAWFWITRYHQHVRNLASRDTLTGLLHRQAFTQTFHAASIETQRLKFPLCLILFDIDFLKKINETQGHASGDQIIRELAELTQRSVRSSDILCRWGGEQFAVLLKRCELDQAYRIAEQLRMNVQQHQFSKNGRGAAVTISLGVAQWTDSESMDALAIRVDEAVFLAKSEGRNRAEISYYGNLS